MKIYFLLIPIFISCRSQTDLEEFNDQYSAALNEAIKEKLLRDPDIFDSFGTWGEIDSFYKGNLYVCDEKLTFYINPMIRDTGRIGFEHWETNISTTNPCKIFLRHEGTVIDRKRTLESFDVNMEFVLRSLLSNPNDSALNASRTFELKSNNSPKSGVLMTLSQPLRSENSIYQVVEFSNQAITNRVYVTISFDRSTLQFRHYDHFFS